VVQVAKLSADLVANTSSFEEGMKRASKFARGFEKQVVTSAKLAAGALATATVALGALAVKQAAVIDQTAKLASSLGISIKEFQAMALVADEAGVDVGGLTKSIGLTQRALYEAAQGSETAGKAFKALNLSTADLLKLSPDQQFNKIAEALGAIQNPTERTVRP
jgi:hypothetical protein